MTARDDIRRRSWHRCQSGRTRVLADRARGRGDVFAILSAGLALTIDGGLNLARNNRNRSIGANLASQEMDDVRQASFTSLPLGLVDRSETVDGVPYTVRRETEWIDNASTTGPCDSTNSTPRVLRVSVSVFWADMRGVAPAKSSTILSPPVGSFDPLNGHIAVKVLGGSADPLRRSPDHGDRGKRRAEPHDDLRPDVRSSPSCRRRPTPCRSGLSATSTGRAAPPPRRSPGSRPAPPARWRSTTTRPRR